jgi:hypothetical protein
MTPAQLKLRAQVAANARWSRQPAAERRAPALRGQAGLLARFEREVDPEGRLDPAERTRLAEQARKSHMQRLSLASSRARAARKGGAADAGAA